MKHAITIPLSLCLIFAAAIRAQPGGDPTTEILVLEHQIMDGWLKGDPGPALALCDPQITFIHEVTGQRLDGLPALKSLYDQRRGTPLFDSYEIQQPKVQMAGDVAILTYRLAQHVNDSVRYWNGTEVFWRTKDGWRILHSHWSATKDQ